MSIYRPADGQPARVDPGDLSRRDRRRLARGARGTGRGHGGRGENPTAHPAGRLGEGHVPRATFSDSAPGRCVLCPATGSGTGWTARTLTESIVWRSIFDHIDAGTPAGDYLVCPGCSVWLAGDWRDSPLPPNLVEMVDAIVTAADLHPRTGRALRAELVGMVRHLADRLTPADAR